MNLLIVDDEYYSADGIHQKIKAAMPDLTEITCCYSMEEACVTLSKRPYDIVITDIEMPKGSGLDLVAWIRDQQLPIVCIFLTSFATFDYASKAVKLQGFDYLLKPVESTQLMACLQKAIARSREIQMETQHQLHANYWRSARVQIAEQFWKNLSTGAIAPQQSVIKEEMRRLGLAPTLTDQSYIPILLKCSLKESEVPWDPGLYAFAVKNILSEVFFGEHIAPAIIAQGETACAILLPAAGSREDSLSLCRRALDACEKSIPGSFVFFVGPICAIAEISRTLEEVKAFSRDHLQSQNAVLDTLLPRKTRQEAPPIPADQWLELLLALKTEIVEKEARDYLSSLALSPQAGRGDLIHFYHDFLQILYTAMDKNGAAAHELLLDSTLSEESACESLDTILLWLTKLLKSFNSAISAANRSSDIVNEVCRYIKDHLSDDLTREKLASNVFISPDYLTHIFREKKSTSLTNYITEKRIRYAKELLLTNNHSIRDIALMSGFPNISYFSKLFKRATGKTPQQYRKSP